MKARLLPLAVALLFAAPLCVADDFQTAAAAFERKDLATAETILHGLLRAQPNDPAALSLMGAVLDEEKKYAQAETAYRRALRVAPNSPSVLNNFGNHLMASGNKAAARATFLKVIALRPDHVNANLQLATLAAEDKNGAEAVRNLDRLPSTAKSSPEYVLLRLRALYLANRDREADALLASLPANSRDGRMDFSIGLALAGGGRYANAEIYFARAAEAVPGDAVALYNLGLAALHAGHNERARDALQMALAKKPQDIDAIYNLALANINLKQLAAAIALLSEAVRLDPARAEAQLRLADTASALGYYGDAASAYEKYLKLKPGDAYAKRERTFVTAVQGRREDQAQAMEAFVRAHPRDATAHYEIAVLKMSSDPANASAHLEQALAIQPDFGPARFGRGVLSYLQGKFAAALPDLEFAASRYPDNANVLDRLGSAYLHLDRCGEAANTLRKAAELAPDDARILMHLSRALLQSGAEQEARLVLDRFRAIGADRVNRLPAGGFVDLISLPPDQLYKQYRAEVERRLRADPQDTAVNVRYLKVLLGEQRSAEAKDAAARLLALEPPAALAAEAGRALLESQLFSDAETMLTYAASSNSAAGIQVDLAIAVFHTRGCAAGLERLDGVPEAQRSGDYYLARADMLDAAGRSAEAVASVQRAITAGSSRSDLYGAAARLLVRAGRRDDAERLFAEAARALPDNPKILLMQAAISAYAGRAGEAERALLRVENRWPEWAPAYATHGILLQMQKRSREALIPLETAVALGSSDPNLQYYFAEALLDTAPKRIDDAQRALDAALAASPDDARMLTLAGRIDCLRRDFARAVEHLAAATHANPNYLSAHLLLMEAYTALGRNEDAAREAEEVDRLRQLHSSTEDRAVEQLLPRSQ